MAYDNFKKLSRTTISDKVLHDIVFNFAKNSKYDGYQRGLPSMVYDFLNQMPTVTQANFC